MLMSILMVNYFNKKKIMPMFKYLLFCVLVMRYYVIYLRGSWLLIYYRRKESRICSLFLYIMFVFA